jgi:nucleotide-binding universal stress UspA family protein
MKMLVCSDGSPQAEKAVQFGCKIACALQAEVSLLGISEDTAHADQLMDSLRRSQRSLTDNKIAVELITKSGHVIAEIVKRTEETKYDLVVIGAVRKDTRGLFWLSSKSYKIIKVITPPVIVVVGERPALQKILICSGGKQYIEKALKLTGTLAKATGASVTLLHVMPELPSVYTGMRQRETDVDRLLNSNSELGRNLRQQKATLESMGVTVQLKLPTGFVQQQILGEIHRGDYDLVVTGTMSSAGPMQTYMMGDVTREIVNRADRPVLIVRSREGLKGIIRELKHAFAKIREDFEPAK